MRKHLSFIGFLLAFLFPAIALAAQASVTLGNNSITPYMINVNAGDTVVWTNTSGTTQSVTADNNAFQSGSIAPGGQFAATFDTSGTYNYYDNANGSAVVAEIIVSGPSVTTPTPVPTPAVTGPTTYVNPNENYTAVTPTPTPTTSNSSTDSLIAWLTSEVQALLAQINAITGGAETATGTGSSSSVSSGTSGSTTGVVSGFLQVTPISGSAPLSTTITATVNTAGSCAGSTYTLDFGDGSQQAVIPVAAGDCSQQNQSFPHTYQYGGTYTVTLSSGTHSSTATVTVSGPSQPSGETTASGTTQGSGSISAPVSSGPAPLSTTFYVSCSSGLAYDVVFGDGNDIGSSGVSQASCNGGLQAIAHTYQTPGSYTAQLVIFVRNSQGTVSSQNIAQQNITVTAAQ
jgi:plastocyanin